MAVQPAPMTTQALVNYYANLLILQYLQHERAYATVQTQVTPVIMPQATIQQITFSGVPASGSFKLEYDGELTSTLSWNSSAAAIQTALRLLTGLGSVTVTGSLASQSLVVTFLGVAGVALPLTFGLNTLVTSGTVAITPTITETDVILPLAVQNAFNLNGADTAVGAQLDILGKYTGVTRSGNGFSGPITLADDEFLKLIQLAIVTNSAQSDLATIQSLLHEFFPDEILVFDYQNMRMSYLISSSIGSQGLVQLFVTEGLLPKPMGVQLSVTVYTPIITSFFGFRTYDLPQLNAKPFNTYDNYNLTWSWLTYADGVGV